MSFHVSVIDAQIDIIIPHITLLYKLLHKSFKNRTKIVHKRLTSVPQNARAFCDVSAECMTVVQ